MRISDWSSDVCSSDLIFPTISIRKHRNRVQSLQDKLVGARKKHLGYGPGKGKKGGAVGNSVDERIKRIMQGSPMLGADATTGEGKSKTSGKKAGTGLRLLRD